MKSYYNKFATYIERRFKVDAHYFLKGGFWLISTQGILIVLGIVSLALFANYLSEVDYGTYRYLINVAIILSSFSLTGLGQAIIQTATKKYFHFYSDSLKLSFTYNSGISIAGVTGGIYYYINSNIDLAIGCFLIAILQPLINTYSYIPGFLQGSRRFKESTIVQSVKAFVTTIFCVISLLLTQNILFLFFVYLFSQTLTNYISHKIYKPKPHEGEICPQTNQVKYIANAKHTSVRNMISIFAFKLDSILIFTNIGAAEVAIYTIANIIPEQIKGTFKNLTTLLLPKYTKHNGLETIKLSIRKRSWQLFLILLSISFLYVLIAPYLYELIFPKYQSAVLYSQLFALIFPSYIYYLPLTALQSVLDEKKLYYFHTHTSIFQIIITFVFISLFGLLGAVIARMVTQYTRMVYCFWLTYK